MNSLLPVSRRLIAGVAGLCAFSAALPAAERDSLRLLAIGNSFSDYSIAFLPALAKEAGKTLVLGRAIVGGCTLDRHAEHLAAALADPAGPKGRFYKNSPVFNLPGRDAVSLPEALAAQPWEIVTLQQESWDSGKPETYRPAIDRLIEAVRRYAPQAEIVLLETWVYRDDHPAFRGADGFTQQRMHENIRSTYQRFAADYGFRLIPAGDAMELARKSPRWTFVPDPDFDLKNPPASRLPREPSSLWVGWGWWKPKSGAPKLVLDGKHPSVAGQYLGNAVWYQVMFGADEVPPGFVPRGLTAEDTADLRGHAAAAVRAERARVAAPVGAR